VIYSRYCGEFESQSGGRLPRYLGSTLRGAFGHALKRLVCAVPRSECGTCAYRAVCIYTQLFEPFNPKTNKTIPVGFVLEPGRSRQRQDDEGIDLDLRVTLLGRTNRYLPYFVHLFRDMARRGFGVERIPFRLIRFWALTSGEERELVYEDGDEHLTPIENTFPCFDSGLSTYPPENVGRDDRVAIEFLTPCRVKIGGRLVNALEFEDLMRVLFRRLSALDHFYGNELLDLRYDPWLHLAGEVRTVGSSLRWVDWERYSNRQKTKMKLGGFVGRVEYEGPIEPFLPFLHAGVITHIGKNASFGLGQYRLDKGCAK